MNSIKDLLPGSMRERTFQLKARRDAGAVWNDPQFVECKKCGRRATRQIWNKAQYVCPNCGVHLPIGGYYRLSLVLDKGSFRELDADLAPQDVLQFPGYPEKLEAQTGKTGLKEAVITATGRIEGSSGGALALGVANRILMLENAVYSVLSPEGFASILWKDPSRSGEACEIMKLTAQDLYKDGIVEEIIPEPVGGAQRAHGVLFGNLDEALQRQLRSLARMNGRQLAAALALGACGVQVGTCLLASEECPIHENYKAALLKAKDSDTIVTGRTVGAPVRVLKNRMSREYVRQEKAGEDKMELEKYTLGSLRRAVFEGDTDTGSLMAGQVAGMLHEVRPVADILADLWQGGRQRIAALNTEC